MVRFSNFSLHCVSWQRSGVRRVPNPVVNSPHSGGKGVFPCDYPKVTQMGGAEGTRTPDPLHAMQVRYQLRHSPKKYFDGKEKYSLYALAVIS